MTKNQNESRFLGDYGERRDLDRRSAHRRHADRLHDNAARIRWLFVIGIAAAIVWISILLIAILWGGRGAFRL